jgi:hypothetical protein
VCDALTCLTFSDVTVSLTGCLSVTVSLTGTLSVLPSCGLTNGTAPGPEEELAKCLLSAEAIKSVSVGRSPWAWTGKAKSRTCWPLAALSVRGHVCTDGYAERPALRARQVAVGSQA